MEVKRPKRVNQRRYKLNDSLSVTLTTNMKLTLVYSSMLPGPEHSVVINREGLTVLMKNFDLLTDKVESSSSTERFSLPLETCIYQQDGITDLVTISTIPPMLSKFPVLIESTRVIHKEMIQQSRLPSQWISLTWPMFTKLNSFLVKFFDAAVEIGNNNNNNVVTLDGQTASSSRKRKRPSISALIKKLTPISNMKKTKRRTNMTEKKKKEQTNRLTATFSENPAATLSSQPVAREASSTTTMSILENFKDAIGQDQQLLISNQDLVNLLVGDTLASIPLPS